MSDIGIIPLFNQDAAIWDDFLSVRCAAICGAYNQKLSPDECRAALKGLESAWRRRKHNFAYAAYDNADMIGFVQGDCMSGVATVRGLYVRPEYQKSGIGYKLLQNAERTARFGAHSMDLIALLGAVSFYKKCGYTALCFNGTASNHFAKCAPDLPHCGVLPLFCATAPVKNACSRIAHDNNAIFNPADINKKHMPAYVYLDVAGDIQAYGINDNILGGAHQPVAFIAKRMHRAFQEFNTKLAKTR